MSLYYRRATRSDADGDCGADIVLELSIGIPHHFVHILGVNENENSVNGRSGTFSLSTRTRFHVRPADVIAGQSQFIRDIKKIP